MKRIVSVLLALAVLAALAIVATTSKHGVRAVYARSGCSNATLTGNYGWAQTAWNGTGRDLLPSALVALVTFNEDGTLSAPYIYQEDGGGGARGFYTAKYTVNPDCTVSITSTNGEDNFWGVIVSGGAEVFLTDITATGTSNVDAKKVQ